MWSTPNYQDLQASDGTVRQAIEIRPSYIKRSYYDSVMTEITPVLSGILVKAHSARPLQEYHNASNTLDSFLSEATRINAHISSLLQYLRRIRQPYLSTAPPPRRNLGSTKFSQSQQSIYLSDAQRDNIDSSTAAVLQDLSRNIQALTQAENLRQQTQTSLLHKKYGKPDGLLWRWAAGGLPVDDAPKSKEQTEDEGRATTIKSVRESVLWYLGRQLQYVTEMQREMVEKRINREKEKEKSILYKMTGVPGRGPNNSIQSPTSPDHMVNGSHKQHHDTTHPYNPATSPDETQSIESQLSPQQLQLFAAENSTLMQHYNDQLSRIQAAEKSLLEISSLQQTLVSHLSTQGEMIEQLVSDAAGTDENVRKGNKQLRKANERGSTARGVFWGSVVLCGFLVGWDLVF